MNKSEPQPPPAFGDVDMNAEHGIFVVDVARDHSCRLTLIGHTERGYPRRELASIPGVVWKEVAAAVQNELVRGMEGRSDSKVAPKLVTGENALSPLMTRELSVLLWALMEDEDGTHTDALFAGWKQLACEERWWLYARASSPAQKKGQGWRRALFFALNDPADTRTNSSSLTRRVTKDGGDSSLTRRVTKEESDIATRSVSEDPNTTRRISEDQAGTPAAKKKSPARTRTPSTGSAPAAKPKRATKKSGVTAKTQPEASAKKKASTAKKQPKPTKKKSVSPQKKLLAKAMKTSQPKMSTKTKSQPDALARDRKKTAKRKTA